MPNWCRCALTAALVILLAAPGAAQNRAMSDTLIVFEELVVSSSRIPQTVAGSGRNITIIPGKSIRELPVHTTDEVLRYISGVEVQSRGAFGTQADFSIRGSTFSQVLVMVDGMRLNDPLTAHFNSNIPVAPSQIQRIEVLHGPAAAQYGADAVGGVINIITKTFNRRQAAEQSQAEVQAGYGQYKLKMGKAGFFHQSRNFRLGGGGMWFQSPGQSLDGNYKNRFNNRKASLSAGLRLGKGWDLAVRTAYDDRDYNARYFYTASPFDDATERVTAWWNQLQLAQRTGNSTTTFKASFKRNTDDFIFNPESAGNHHSTKLFNVQLYQFRKWSPQWSLTYGLQSTNRYIRSNDRGNHSDWHYAGFSMLQWQPAEPLTLSGSLRLDHDQSYGTELMPQLSVSYKTGRWVLRASGGRSIRAPSYTEQYISTNLAGPLSEGRNIGNPWLQAERSWSAEAGVDLFALQGLRLSVTGFVRSSSDLIDYVLTNSGNIRNDSNLQPDTDYLHTNNLNSVRTAGLETQLSFSRRLWTRWLLTARAGYTFTDSFSDQNAATKYVSNYARHLLNGILSLQHGPLEVALSGLWKQRRGDAAEAITAEKSRRYSLWNVKVGYRLHSNLRLAVEADNLFDAEYQDILGAQMPGRWLMGSLSWSFNR